MTITHVAVAPSHDGAPSQHGAIVELLLEAAHLPHRSGLADVLALVSTAVHENALTSQTAFHLGQQLRLVVGDHPVDDDLEAHLLLQTLLFELTEVASLVEGVHVDDLDPVLDHLLAVGDIAEARRLMLLAEGARSRALILERPLAHDLGAA